MNNYFQVPTAVCTCIHVTHMLPLINGYKGISMMGDAGLSKTTEKQSAKKIWAKMFPLSDSKVNYTQRNQRLIPALKEKGELIQFLVS